MLTRKIGQNRGRPRLWLEGRILSDAGFVKGDRWNLVPTEAGIDILKDAEGARKIAGTDTRPIIDIMGSSLGLLATVEVVVITQAPGHLTVIPKDPE